ncbi:MAG: hypothetical protein ACR2RF_09010 [Geminicoccaceae bacterium]
MSGKKPQDVTLMRLSMRAKSAQVDERRHPGIAWPFPSPKIRSFDPDPQSGGLRAMLRHETQELSVMSDKNR